MPYIRDNLVRLYSKVTFSIDMLKTIKLHSSVSDQSRKRYVYQFDIKPAEGVIHPPSWSKGAIHADELQNIFFNEMAGILTVLPGRDYLKAEEWESEEYGDDVDGFRQNRVMYPSFDPFQGL